MVMRVSNCLVKLEQVKGTLDVTAFCGAPDDQGRFGASVQFTMGEDYVVLNEAQVVILLCILEKRLKRVNGFRATDESEPWDGVV